MIQMSCPRSWRGIRLLPLYYWKSFNIRSAVQSVTMINHLIRCHISGILQFQKFLRCQHIGRLSLWPKAQFVIVIQLSTLTNWLNLEIDFFLIWLFDLRWYLYFSELLLVCRVCVCSIWWTIWLNIHIGTISTLGFASNIEHISIFSNASVIVIVNCTLFCHLVHLDRVTLSFDNLRILIL